MLERLEEIIIFAFGGFEINLLASLAWLLFIIAIYFIYRGSVKFWLPMLFKQSHVSTAQKRKLTRLLQGLFVLILISFTVWVFQLDFDLISTQNNTVNLLLVLMGLVILQLARIVDWLITQYIIHNNYIKRDQDKSKDKGEVKKHTEEKVNRTVQYLVYVLAIIILLRKFSLDLSLFTFNFNENNEWDLRITNLFAALFILLLGRLIIWVITQIILYGYYKQKNIDSGTQYAINRLIAYVIYVIAIIAAMESLGFKMTLMWGGAAALLVGVGLGLQQTFNDFFSGLVILFERSIQVGDILDVNGKVGKVKKIGLRASLFEMRESYTMIIPNSKLVNNDVLNWSSIKDKTRFVVKTSVAYGSDTKKVKSLLLQAATENKYVSKYPPSFVRFTDFGDSGLLFELHFFSKHLMIIEDIKSDLRFQINQLFIDHQVTVPFPQRDVWLRKSD